jgi:hypothetical protein
MTDEEYLRLLNALGSKHLCYPQSLQFPTPTPRSYDRGPMEELHSMLGHVSDTLRLLKSMKGRDDPGLLDRLLHNLALSPVRMATTAMEASGILDALDDAPDLVLGELRRSVIPKEEEEYLRNAGFDADDIEVLLALAVYRAPALVSTGKLPSDVAEEAIDALDTVVQVFMSPTDGLAAKKKRKIFNGIGKLLGGAVAGIGNALLVAGTLIAPNPATGYGAIVSGGIAVTSFFAGLGDLKGE